MIGQPSRRFVLADDGIIDPVAVEIAARGTRPVALTHTERQLAAAAILARGGTPYVGEKHLVRIEEAGRSAATASLVDVEPGPEDEDDVESKPRRRGRRGGRRRSGAKAESAAPSE